MSEQIVGFDDLSITKKTLYFINEIVEDKLRRYIWTGCVDSDLRDSIMGHASELITQIIRKQNLHVIYPGQEESAFGDLVQTAWVQIERTLYKFRSRPHCRGCYNPDRPADSALYEPGLNEYGIITYDELFIWLGMRKRGYSEASMDKFRENWRRKQLPPNRKKQEKNLSRLGRECPHCGIQLTDEPYVEPLQGRFGGTPTILYRGSSKVFNMWSQVARTVILAFVKKEGRDRKNATAYRSHLCGKHKVDEDRLERFFGEAEELFKYNDDHLRCVGALKRIITSDDKPWEGIISKLVDASGLSRTQITSFIKVMRLRSTEFTDSPLSQENGRDNYGRRQSNTGPEYDDA